MPFVVGIGLPVQLHIWKVGLGVDPVQFSDDRMQLYLLIAAHLRITDPIKVDQSIYGGVGLGCACLVRGEYLHRLGPDVG